MQAQTEIISNSMLAHFLLVGRLLYLFEVIELAMIVVIIPQFPRGIEVHVKSKASIQANLNVLKSKGEPECPYGRFNEKPGPVKAQLSSVLKGELLVIRGQIAIECNDVIVISRAQSAE